MSFLEVPFTELLLPSETQGTSLRKGWAEAIPRQVPGCHLIPCGSPPVLEKASVTQKTLTFWHVTRLHSTFCGHLLEFSSSTSSCPHPYGGDHCLGLSPAAPCPAQLPQWGDGMRLCPALPLNPGMVSGDDGRFTSKACSWANIFCDPWKC